jgi:hypothetical protein
MTNGAGAPNALAERVYKARAPTLANPTRRRRHVSLSPSIDH